MSDAIRIRRAHPEDAERLTAIALASKRHWNYPDEWIEAWRDDLTFTAAFVSEHAVYVAVDANGSAIACYALVSEGEGFRLEHVWVDPPHIGRGLGRTLFDHAMGMTQAAGATHVLIDSDPNAEPFYLRMGARRMGTIRADVCGVRRELPRLRFDLG